MQKKYRMRFACSFSDSRKSKIQNRKLVGIVALVVTLAMAGTVAQAQQTGKIFRIGFLDVSTASASAFRRGRSGRRYANLGGSRERTLPSSLGLQRGTPTVYLSLPRSWCVLSLI